ncbi:hypothetical protein IWW55_005087, partial [Coemansia sp. RSA 2706]
RGPRAHGGAGRVVWRVHGQLDQRAHQPVCGAGGARRQVQHGVGVLRDGRAVVPRVGPGQAVGCGGARGAGAEQPGALCRAVQDADAVCAGRARLPHPGHGVAGRVGDAAAARDPGAAGVFPRRGPLGHPRGQLGALVHRGAGLDHAVDQHHGAVPDPERL